MDLRREHLRRSAGRGIGRLSQIFSGSSSRHRGAKVTSRLSIEQLEPRLALAGVIINEFLALNDDGLMDEDGDRSDWIELKNTDAQSVNLGGWYLTDDESDLSKWQIPNTELAAGAYLVIFASGKDRAVAGQELHADFALSGDGEFLALVMPDGTTIADSFAPFPAQVDDVSYGRGASGFLEEPLVNANELARVHVPTDDSLGLTWTEIAFDDSGWLEGDSPIGYERSPGGALDYTGYFELDVNALMPAPTPPLNIPRDTIYMRIPFTVTDIDELASLELLMLYDDGFVAYLNGELIAQVNAPASPEWNSSASGTHSDSLAVVYQEFSVDQHLGKLVEGENVLAIHGLNQSNNRTDFLIGPRLDSSRATEAFIGYMSTPTPGAPNLEGNLGFVADTRFSVDRGFYDSPFEVEITTETEGAQIRYTTDGSEPTATHGTIYAPANPPLITTTTTLRAAAFKSGMTPTNIDTQTYIFLDDVLQQDGSGLQPYQPWSHFSQIGVADADWEMDPNIVNHPQYTGTIKDDMQVVDSVSVVLPWDELFGFGGIYIAGKNVERGASIELISPNGGGEFQIDGAFEIMGQTSPTRWNLDKLSFRVTFKQPFGPTDLDFPLFTDPFFDQGTPDVYDTFVLDAVYNHSWAYGRNQEQRDTAKFIQDQFVADLQNMTGGLAPHGRYIHLYLNGLYWGMYYLHERPDDVFAASYLGGDNDDYDVVKHVRTDVVAGDATATANYDAMLDAVRQNLSVPANYEAVEEWLAIDEFIDYMIVNYYVGNHDWALNTGGKNWYASYNRVDPNGKWRFHSWDAEHVLEALFEDRTFLTPSGQPTEIHNLLMGNPEYHLRFADRVQKHMHNGGIMTPETAAEIFAARMEHIDRAIVGESARWGDNRREPAYTRDDWLANMNDLLFNYLPQRTNIVLNQFAARNWLVPLPAPEFSQYGGAIPVGGYDLTLAAPAGTPRSAEFYYTLDGSDPRNRDTKLPSSSAILYSGPIHLETATEVKARIFYEPSAGTDEDWSPVVEAVFLPENPFPVRITELHFNPASQPGVADAQDMEFIELTNTGSETVNLNGLQIAYFAETPYVLGDIDLAAGERIVVARNPTVFQQVYGMGINIAPNGYADANLSNGGERIALIGALGEVLQDFEYDDMDPWPTSPDGGGYSLHIIDPLGDPSDPANWRASVNIGGSPGADDEASIAGDYDGNGVVELADHGVWRASFGMAVAVPGSGADGTGDGMVDAADFVFWRKAYAAAQNGGSGGATADSGAGSVGESVALVTSQTVAESTNSVVATASPAAPSVMVAAAESSGRAARPAFRPTRSVAIAPAADRTDLLTLELRGEAVDAALGAEPLRGDIQDDEPAESVAEAAGLWDDTAWLEKLSVSL